MVRRFYRASGAVRQDAGVGSPGDDFSLPRLTVIGLAFSSSEALLVFGVSSPPLRLPDT
jgi:hypothetical protein